MSASPASGPVLFGYDGSEFAQLAIARAAVLLAAREALVACVWQPFDLGFVPLSGLQIDATDVEQVRAAAEETAAAGAALAREAGFSARTVTVESSPVWKGVTGLADEHHASLIVLGSRGRHGAKGALLGSVAGSVASHSHRDVLIVHRGPQD